MIQHDTAIKILQMGLNDLCRLIGCIDVCYGHLSGTAHAFFLCDVITESEYEFWNDAIDNAYLERDHNE